jgi:hypothetical protein
MHREIDNNNKSLIPMPVEGVLNEGSIGVKVRALIAFSSLHERS